MRISITHSTTYTYAKFVQLAPHVIRLRPRCDGALWLIHFDIRVEPQPSALSQCFDLEGNTVTHANRKQPVLWRVPARRFPEATSRIHDGYAGVRILPEVGLFVGDLVRENYSNRPEASSLFLYPVIVVCRYGVVSAGR